MHSDDNTPDRSLSSQPSNPLLEAALGYRRRGWSLIPLKPHDKRPALDSWEAYQRHLPTEEEVKAWWRRWRQANIGAVAGAISGFFVVDVDGPEGRETLTRLGVPPTPAAETSPERNATRPGCSEE